jgi:hypothetical protein
MVMESTPATEPAELRRPGRLVNPEDLASACDLLSMALNGTNTGFLGRVSRNSAQNRLKRAAQSVDDRTVSLFHRP